MWRREYCSKGIFFEERKKILYIISKKARRVEGAIEPLFISFPILGASVLKIAAFRECALKVGEVTLVWLDVDFIVVLEEEHNAVVEEEERKRWMETAVVAELRGRGQKVLKWR